MSEFTDSSRRSRLGRPWPAWASMLLAFFAGILVAVVADYVLYRIGIAGTPFIYVSF